MALAHIYEPINAAGTPMATKLHNIFLLLRKLNIAESVPRVLTSFSCPNATCGGSPANMSDGNKTNPAPPATLSMNPATNEAKINKLNPSTNESASSEPSKNILIPYIDYK